MCCHTPVDIHRVAERQLPILIHSFDLHRHKMDMVRVESSIEGYFICPFAECVRELRPMNRLLPVSEVRIKSRHLTERLVVPRVVPVHDPPERVFVDLEIEPVMAPRGIVEVPSIHRIGALHELMLPVPAPLIGQNIVERLLHMRQEALEPPVVPGRLPCKMDCLDKAELDISLDRHADVLCPVFLLARDFLWGHREVIEQPALSGLSLGKMIDRAPHVTLPILGAAQHIGVIAQPNARCIGRTIAADLCAEHVVFGRVATEKIFDAGNELVELRVT